MNLKIVIAFVAIAEILGLAGCKPKETTVTGQVFIVTQGAENIKLGLVEVQLIPKQQVIAFLKIKTPTVEAEISSRQRGYETVKDEAQKASANLNSFETDGPLTKAEYKSLKSEYQSLIETNSQLSYAVNVLDAEFEKLASSADLAHKIKYSGVADDKQKADADKTIAALEAFDNTDYTNKWRMVNEWHKNNWQMFSIKIKTDKIEADANSNKADLESQFAEAQSRLKMAKAKLNDYPTGESYLAGFIAPVIQKKLTDADGKFSFTYPCNSALTIFAKAERMVGSKAEKYFWVVNAPTNSETAQVLLGNQNLVCVDPDGYFKIKPVATAEESEASQPTSGN